MDSILPVSGNLSWLLWAQVDRAVSMGSRFRGDAARLSLHDLLMTVTLVLAVAVAVWGLSVLLRRQDRTRRYLSHRALFRNLSKAHGLSMRQRRLLKELAKAHRLPHASRLFLEPEKFVGPGLPKSLHNRQADYIALRDKLFAGLDLTDLAA